MIHIRNRNYFQDELDAFEKFIDERLQELNALHRLSAVNVREQRKPRRGI